MQRKTVDERLYEVHQCLLAEFANVKEMDTPTWNKMLARAQQIGAELGLTITTIQVAQEDPSEISYGVLLPGDSR
jgi:hypothetical protein